MHSRHEKKIPIIEALGDPTAHILSPSRFKPLRVSCEKLVILIQSNSRWWPFCNWLSVPLTQVRARRNKGFPGCWRGEVRDPQALMVVTRGCPLSFFFSSPFSLPFLQVTPVVVSHSQSFPTPPALSKKIILWPKLQVLFFLGRLMRPLHCRYPPAAAFLPKSCHQH